MSNSCAAASSSRAAASRRARTSGGSVPRPVSLRTSSSQDGGARNTSRASGSARLTCRAPATSISSRQATPASSFSLRAARGACRTGGRRTAPTPAAPRRRPAGQTRRRRQSDIRAPSTSPGRGWRVVTDTEIQISGQILRSSATTVLFPTPEGPESTVSRECTGVATADSAEDVVPVCRAVQISAPNSCSSADRWLVPSPRTRRDSAMPSLSMICFARTLPTPGRDSSRAETFILPITSSAGAILDDIGQGGGPALEAVLHLGAFFACTCSLLQRRRTFFRSEGRKSHSGSPRVSLEKGLSGGETSQSRTLSATQTSVYVITN